MGEDKNLQDTKSFFLDFGNRLRDIDERNKLVRERILLLGKNFLASREELEKELEEIKKENREIKKEIEQIKKVNGFLVSEFEKFVKKDEIYLVERMLKDFQPLEFMRKKDVEKFVEERLGEFRKRIKMGETKK